MAEKYIYVKLIKEWGGFQIGDVVRFGINKGQGRIDKGEGIKVTKQKAVNDPIIEVPQKPKVEVAMVTSKAETTDARPDIKKIEPPEVLDKKAAKVHGKAGE